MFYIDVNDDIKEMMSAQGLLDVVQGGISELVAYLLVERARLMDELDASMLQSSNIINTPDGQMTVEQLVEVNQFGIVWEGDRFKGNTSQTLF